MINKNILISVLCILGMAFTACTKDDTLEPTPTPDGTAMLPISFSMDFEGDEDPFVGTETADSRSAPTTVNESSVNNVWLFQFDGQSTTSKLISPPRYLNSSAMSGNVPFIAMSGNTRILAIANTSNPDFVWNAVAGKTTYAEISAVYKKINTENDTYFDGYIMMSGYFDTSNLSGASSVSIALRRSVAKVVFQITNNSSLAIKKVQLCNVNACLDVMAGQITQSSTYPKQSSATYINYNEETVSVGPSATATYNYYVPRNEQGTSSNTVPAMKNGGARPGATYFRIMATNASGDATIFKFYPGANMTNDFNLKPNNRYTIGITINSAGDPSADGRIENYSVVDLASKSANSYILNPPKESGYVRKYRIYPKQINIYWGNRGYESSVAAMIGSGATGKKWYPKIIWMDDAGLVTSAANTTTLTANANARGETDYFEITVPSTAKPGNFTIGVFNNDDGDQTQQASEPYLWSWHFWVTDYNPDIKVSISPAQYAYAVEGGEVHRYGGSIWTSGIYSNAVIMDRYLGMITIKPNMANNYLVNASNRGPLYYQYGRKDPFPGNISLYTLSNSGVVSAVSYALDANSTPGGPASTVTIQTSIANPLTFYTNALGDWTSTTDETSSAMFLWKDIQIVANQTALAQNTSKSLYDPCPYGWQIPNNGTWVDFNTATAFSSSRGLDWTIGGHNALRYWPGTGAAENAVLYQPLGFRNGSVINTRYYGYAYSSTPQSTLNAYHMQLTSSSVSTTNSVRSNAYSVRCIKVNAN